MYVTNRDAGEGDSEAQEVDPNEIIVWNRPEEFMGGKFAVIEITCGLYFKKTPDDLKSSLEKKIVSSFSAWH